MHLIVAMSGAEASGHDLAMHSWMHELYTIVGVPGSTAAPASFGGHAVRHERVSEHERLPVPYVSPLKQFWSGLLIAG
jgi:hypothetical protein